MSTTKKTKIQKVLPLVNTILNDRLCLYSQTGNKSLLLRHCSCPSNQICIMPTYADTFIGIISFVTIVDNNGLCCYVTTAINEENICSPMLVIYDPADI